VDITNRPSLSKDAIRLLKIAEQQCYSETLSGLIIEITTVFLHRSTQQPPAKQPLIEAEPGFDPLPEVNLDGLANIDFFDLSTD